MGQKGIVMIPFANSAGGEGCGAHIVAHPSPHQPACSRGFRGPIIPPIVLLAPTPHEIGSGPLPGEALEFVSRTSPPEP